jgi:hypothetical protein
MGPFLGCFVGLVVLVHEIFVLLGCQPSTKYFLIALYFTSFVPISQQPLGRQSCYVAYLLICVSGFAS